MYSHSSQVSSRHTFFVEFIGLPETEYAALFFSQPKKKELEVVESDFSKLLAEGKAAEEQAIKIYEEQTTENKIATKTKETEIKYKTKDQKETEALLESLKEDIGGSQKELDAINQYWAREKKMTPDPPFLIFNWLVLLCIDSYDSEQRRILQHFSRSTRFAFFSRP